MVFHAVRIEQENRRRPRRFVTLAIALERLRVLFHMHARRNKGLGDEARDAWIRPHLGIQPSTATSHWCGAEVEKYRFLLGFGLFQDLIDVVTKVDRHRSPPGVFCTTPIQVFFWPMSKGTIGILTGGGDVPGLNPAIRAITIRALRDGYNVIGIRHGWGGLVDYSRDKGADNSEQIVPLTEA